MVQSRALSPAQRSAKNERDRQRRRGLKLEFERLQNVAAKYQEMAPLLDELRVEVTTVRNVISQLAEESRRLNDVEPHLTRKIHQLDNIVRQNQTEQIERRQLLSQWQFKTQAMVLPTIGKEASNEPIDLGVESSRSDIWYTDEFLQDFIEKLDDKEKSRVDFLDFKGLPEELEKCGRFSLPPSLVPIHEILDKAYGDITAESNQSNPVIRDSYILFCSVIKEMNEVQLEQVDLDKMILWRDAINSGLSIGFRGNFAIEHLKKIARAYFGSKAWNDQELKSLEERMSELKAELYGLEQQHYSIIERQSSEMCRECLQDQQYFQGKPLSTGLFLS
ncbi:Fiber protein Fb17 [Theobroma cacao]|uniref:Fiber protein Fb17 n=1 Tax=Theobroma cacao TaxID=3641 RepID=A0A061GDI7_THECC|nr:Fiber protein Fb17 [Theobroma cacao]